MTCKQFVESSKEYYAAIVMWLAGFYADEDEPAVLDFDKIRADGEKLTEYCRKHPKEELMDAADEVLDK